MSKDITESRSHLENFSLRDHIGKSGEGLDERLDSFQDYNESLTQDGINVYKRTVLGKTEREVMVSDAAGGEPHKMLMFGSNNYLSLTTHPLVLESVSRAIEKYGVGSGGPPLFNGTTLLHKELSQKIAAMKGVDDALLFSSGYAAQLAWITSLVDKNDLVIFDEFSHASVMDGLKLARNRGIPYDHNNLDDLEGRLKKYRDRSDVCWLCVEGVFSMDGDIAPLDKIVPLAKKYNCRIALDDAHGLGVMGEGLGTAHHFGIDPADIDVHFGTFSKALGTVGGYVGGNQKMVDYLTFIARQHVFSAALPAPVVATALGGLEVIESEKGLIEGLHENVRYLIDHLDLVGIEAHSDSGIIPVMVPGHANVQRLSREFHRKGVFINSVEFPAVSVDEQRFRISMMATHTRSDIKYLVNTFYEVFKSHNII